MGEAYSAYLAREYEVRVGESVYRLRPRRVWVIKPEGKPGIVIGVFDTPGGEVRMVLDILPP